MKRDFPLNFLKTCHRGASEAFSLVELLVVVSIVAVLAALGLTAMQRVKKSAEETKSLAVLRSVLQSSMLYSADNNGQINTLRYVGDPLEGGPRWVGNTYWGRLQPYIFPTVATSSQQELSSGILSAMVRLFGCGDMTKMSGTPFAGSPRYADGSGLPVPFVFNAYLNPWGKWVSRLQVQSLSGTIYMSYGFGCFNEADAAAYVPMPTGGGKISNNIYYLSSQQAIMGFLDGHVSNLAPPVPATMITITN